MKVEKEWVAADLTAAAIEEEYKRSCVFHESAFHSPHEAYAIIHEEIEETTEALERVTENLQFLWKNYIREDCPMSKHLLGRFFEDAFLLALESMQVATMFRKLKESNEKWESEDESSTDK